MICMKYKKKNFNPRLWKLSSSKELKKKNFPHGRFISDYIWINCKFSFVYLWLNSSRMIGKGIFSRSEPLFLSPNPCYNSLGKAGRERKSLKKTLINHEISENLQISLLEFLFHSKKLNIFTQLELSAQLFKSIILKLDVSFFSIFLYFRNLILRFQDLKSGLKFSGNFLIYKKKNFNFHTHSKVVLTNEEISTRENTCIYCQNFGIQLLDIQNRTRLGAQVSKINLFSFGEFYWKTFFLKNYENFIKREIILNRYNKK